MRNRVTRILALLMLSAALAGTAQAKKLSTFAGSVDLPFDFEIKDRAEAAKNSTVSGFTATQVIRITIQSGPLKGHEARLGAYYYSTSKVDAALMQSWVQKTAEDAAAKPGATGMSALQISGFPFIAMTTNAGHGGKSAGSEGGVGAEVSTGDADAAADDPDGARMTTITGTINNAMLSVSFVRAVNPELDAPLAKSIKGLELDFGSILKLRSRFDQASAAAIIDKRMIAPSGDYAPVDDLIPRLYEVWVKTDAKGVPVAAKNTYLFFKTGFWSNQRMSFSSLCDLGIGQDAKEVAKLKILKSGSSTDKLTVTEGPTPVKFGGLDAARITTKHTTQSGATTSESDGMRWVATDHDTAYVIDMLIAGGSSLERDLVSQIDAHPLTCKPRLMLVLGGGVVGDANASP
jgi:hypothetical protein